MNDKGLLYIGGDWIDTRETETIRLPYDGSVTGTVAQAGVAHVDQAVKAARQAAPAMAEMSNAERSDLLFRLLEILRSQQAQIAETIMIESGKPIKESRIEANRAIDTVLTAAIEARRLTGEAVPIDASPSGKGRLAMTFREPRGVIAAITPFNVPFNLALHKVAPALGSGNAVVHKPSEQTPLSSVLLAKALEEAGCPKGAYNLLFGQGETVGAAMVEHPDVNMITFTGSVEVGKAIRQSSGLKKVTLELGGNSAVIIDPESDVDLAIGRSAVGAFLHSGQTCISVQRVYAHADVYRQISDRLKDAAAKLKIGHPSEDATDISSLISTEAAERVASWMEEAVPGSAKRNRATVTPTVLEEVPDSAKISKREIFGPVVAVYRYTSIDDAIAQVNATPYGLQAGVFTHDIGRAFAAARKLKMGGVMINDIPSFRADPMPYGGVKDSGEGREGPHYTMREMTEEKLVVWR